MLPAPLGTPRLVAEMGSESQLLTVAGSSAKDCWGVMVGWKPWDLRGMGFSVAYRAECCSL